MQALEQQHYSPNPEGSEENPLPIIRGEGFHISLNVLLETPEQLSDPTLFMPVHGDVVQTIHFKDRESPLGGEIQVIRVSTGLDYSDVPVVSPHGDLSPYIFRVNMRNIPPVEVANNTIGFTMKYDDTVLSAYLDFAEHDNTFEARSQGWIDRQDQEKILAVTRRDVPNIEFSVLGKRSISRPTENEDRLAA